MSIQYAGTVDTEGSLPASRKHENRQISLTIICDTAAALRSLQGKIGKVAREGGTLKWNLPNAEVVIFDLLAADSFDPTFDITWQKNAGAYCSVQIALPAAPYGRGPEVDLGDNAETTLPVLIFTETGVMGDMPGLGRLVVDEDQSQAQSYLVWGVESRYYSAAATAALFYQAEAGTLGSGTLAVGPAGASGSGSNTVFDGSLNSSAYRTQFTIGNGSATTHIGAFRVFARCWAPAANTGTVSVQLRWQLGTNAIAEPIDNTAKTIGGADRDFWVLLDLGQVSIPKVKRGTQNWKGDIRATSTVTGDDIYTDFVFLVPVLEGSGEVNGGLVALFSGKSMEIRHDGVIQERTTNEWTQVAKYEGDYLRVPPAGAEGRTVRVIIKADRSTLGSGAASGIDDISARLFVTPRYLVVPSP
jgi:hypothetical protein